MQRSARGSAPNRRRSQPRRAVNGRGKNKMAADCCGDRSFNVITERCLEYFRAPEGRGPMDVVRDVMDDASFPMHNFAHHYLVPAVLLAELCRKDGAPEEEFAKKLEEVRKRARNVLPAFCGLYGACGAAVGCGIFMSVYTGTTPLSKETWGLCNYATAGALAEMAKLGGPRCCKRNTFAALLFMKKYIARHLGTSTGIPDEIVCRYSGFNAECLKEECPFYDKES